METKELKINIPEGYKIDERNSTFNCIKFIPKGLTYEDVTNELFKDSKCYYITNYGKVTWVYISHEDRSEVLNGTSKKQLEKLAAINMLMNVAKYLNKDWKPNWSNHKELKYHIYIGENPNVINTAIHTKCGSGVVYFMTDELARQAIEILGEDTIRVALSTDW